MARILRTLAPTRAPTPDADAQGVNDPTTRRSGDLREQATGSFTPCSPVLWSSARLTQGTAEGAVQPGASTASVALPPRYAVAKLLSRRIPRAAARQRDRPTDPREGTTYQVGGCPPGWPSGLRCGRRSLPPCGPADSPPQAATCLSCTQSNAVRYFARTERPAAGDPLPMFTIQLVFTVT